MAGDCRSRTCRRPPYTGGPSVPTGTALIDTALLETLNTRCDVVLSSVGAGHLPSLCWGMAGRLLEDRRSVEAWVREDQARDFLADVRRSGRVAAVFSEPYTSFAVQLKGRDASVRPATPDDAPLLRRHVDNMVRELERVRFGEAFARAMFEQAWNALAVVRFTAEAVFVQTPGPKAGQPLGDARRGGGDAA